MLTDHELIKKFQNGSEQAFDDLVRRHLTSVVSFFHSITGNIMEAEDLAQDVFLRLYRALKRFRFQAQFTTYLYRVNCNIANNYFKRNRWKDLLHLDQAPDTALEEKDETRAYDHRQLWRTVATLPKQQRLVIMMRISQELPFKTIAEILQTSEGSVKVSYHHGVNKLKELLKQ
ncbi:MAG: RNA polymerase sigma factor [Fidelibacterota bacterium]